MGLLGFSILCNVVICSNCNIVVKCWIWCDCIQSTSQKEGKRKKERWSRTAFSYNWSHCAGSRNCNFHENKYMCIKSLWMITLRHTHTHRSNTTRVRVFLNTFPSDEAPWMHYYFSTKMAPEIFEAKKIEQTFMKSWGFSERRIVLEIYKV